MRGGGFPERQLWCAVVERAWQDAVGAALSAARDEPQSRERREALQWFVDNDPDYRLACDAAGIDPDDLRHRVMRAARQE